MKKLPFISLVLFAIFFSPDSSAQEVFKIKKLDTRVDNLGYWRMAADQGLTAPNPMVPVPSANYTGDEIRAICVITEDSPDVPVITGNTSQSENSGFADPEDNNVVLNSNNSSSTPGGGLTFYGANDTYTFDGGDTWDGQLFGAGGSNSGDPTTSIGTNGRWFVGFINNSLGQTVSHSDNQGDNWMPVVVASGPGGGAVLDKNHLWIDNSSTSPYEGYLYDAWTDFGGAHYGEIEISVSTTNGESWEPYVIVSSNLNMGSHGQGVNITTGPDGQVYAMFAIYDGWPSNEDAMGLARSFDGGQTWEAYRMLQNILGIRTSGTGKNMRVNSYPCITADISSGPNRGNLYAVWTNRGVPFINNGNDIDVYMVRSEDDGETWSDPVRVNQDPTGQGKQHYFPWIECDPESGVLCAIFYDDRNVSSTQCEVYCAVSYDAGDTWEDFKVSDVSFTPTPISGLASGYFGDYLGITANGGKAYPLWTDNRTGVALTYVSPFTFTTIVAPTNLQGTLDDTTGIVDLTWDHPLGQTFDHFNIYRGLTLLGTSYVPSFTDTLQDYGLYRYMVTAYYPQQGESGVL